MDRAMGVQCTPTSTSPALAKGDDTVCELGSVRFGTEKVVCNWTILDYNNWPQGVEEVKSPVFWHSGSTEWCMALSLERGAWYFCFHLLSSQRDPSVRAKLKAVLISSLGKKYEVYPTENISLEPPKKTVRKCVSGCFDTESGFSNILKFQGEVSIPCVITEPYRSVTLQKTIRTVTSDLGTLLNSGDLSDIVLTAGDTEIKAHRALLSARSPVFAAMLHHDTQESQTGSIKILDVDAETLREVLSYIYTDSVKNIEKMADKLLVAADKYDLPQLKVICEVELAKSLTIENAASVAVIALSHSCNLLKQSVICFIKRHLVRVLGTDGWAEAVAHHSGIVIEISRLLGEEVVG